jgi:ATP-dependent helicase/DNAse subunit B
VALTLIAGPANSAKAAEVLGGFAAQRRKGALLVVPTARDAQLYSRELAADGSVMGGGVLTFNGLTREIAKRAGYGGRRISELQRERLVRRATRELRLEELAESAQTPGFVGAAVELIAELERSLVTPDRFARSGAGEAAAIYRAYARELDRVGRVDPELYAWRALDALRANPGRWGSTAVFFYGFDDLTPLERDAIETLSRHAAAEVTVSLTYEAGRAALAARAEAVEELRPLAERVTDLPATDEYYDHPALHYLERRLFEGTEEQIDPDRAVRLLEAGGERAELELVAAEVLELLRAGVAGEEIAVIFRHGPTALVERVFSEYGIPVELEREIPFGHTTLGRGLLALARCALLPDAPASELIAYLRTPGVYDRADEAEAIVLREGIRTAAEARERLRLSLREIDTLNSSRELERQARRLFVGPHKRAAAVLGPDEHLDARALSALTRALSELADVGEQPAGAELVELLESLTIRSPTHGAVRVAEPLEIRAQRFRAVFVCGLQEGSFPAPGSPEPFLSDDRRLELAAKSGLRLRLREDALARECYLFYSCVSRATERVVLSYRSSDEEGNIELPSPFIDDLAELFVPEWRERRRRRLLGDVVWPPAEAPTERERARGEAALAAASGSELGPALRLGESALGRVRHSEILSAGALESYAECPVKWLVERELQPRPLEPDPEPMVRGSVIHELLERLLRELGRPLTTESLEDANRILDRLLDEPVPRLARGRIEAVRTAALRSIEADLRRYLAHEAASGCDWNAEALELKFGFDDESESLPALELAGGVRVRGMIDRVDVDGAGHAIVRDYKSGGKRAAYAGARWAQDRQLQVALYMLAVQNLMGLEPVAGLYQPLGGDDLRSRGVFLDGAAVGASVVGTDARSQDELEEALDDARERATELAARLRSGELEPCPDTCSRDGCTYPGICRNG